MNPAIVIGAYRLTDFVRLNLALCTHLWPDSPILVSDDRSEASADIERVADEYGAHYVCSRARRTHVSGDWQAFINGAEFGAERRLPVLKLSQRFSPMHPRFWPRLQADFQGYTAVMPGKLARSSIARPEARFYLVFGHLTDCLLFDPQVYTPQRLIDVYGPSQRKRDTFSEMAWARLTQDERVNRVDWLANHEPMERKLYLRKATASAFEYQQLARDFQVPGEFDLREWKSIEGKEYRSVPV